MMGNYNYEFIDTRYALMEVFLFGVDENILDISKDTDDIQAAVFF